MEAYLRSQWDASATRMVECQFYQSKVVSATKRVQLTTSGIELFNPTATVDADARGKSADVIPWSDILGAAVLTADQAAHVPGYKAKPAPKTDFVVFGCIPKANAIKNPLIVSGLQVLACFTGSGGDSGKQDENNKKRKRSSAPVGGQCDRILVQWVFRYIADDADAFVPHIARTIQGLADPRTTHFTEPEGEAEPVPLIRRVSLCRVRIYRDALLRGSNLGGVL